jgi:hypothetical protein
LFDRQVAIDDFDFAEGEATDDGGYICNIDIAAGITPVLPIR